MRPPSPGRPESPAVRIVIHASPPFHGSVKLPAKVAPGCSAIVSPGCAALIACCRFAPAGTAMVEANADGAHNSVPAHTRVTIQGMLFIRVSVRGEGAIALPLGLIWNTRRQ